VLGSTVPNQLHAARQPASTTIPQASAYRRGNRPVSRPRSSPSSAAAGAASGRIHTASPAENPAEVGHRSARSAAASRNASTASAPAPCAVQRYGEVTSSVPPRIPSTRNPFRAALRSNTRPAANNQAAVNKLPNRGTSTREIQCSHPNSTATPGSVTPNTLSPGLNVSPAPCARFHA
jgi:hypothetical protein